ncbi:hypothetical protein [Aeoliella mucimassa]|uniref:PEGA domain protein n=1 Tax=Aeoliella mucimassa TaxID=2527972 RepID=A0A518AQZ2_9BACT|nr:hypothetical protein [Aeoliella mucimassa]QDU57138.1 hypothetical protein Pan181_33520 [Aeoliella mucimassa]
MMSWKAWLPLFVIVVMAGCQARFSDTRTFTLDPTGEDIQEVYIDGISSDRTITVTATADAPIDVYFFLEDDFDEVTRMITLGKPTDLVMAEVKGASQINLSATVPAEKSAVVYFRAADKKASIESEISG